MSDFKDKPGPPPDDWTKTTPNINLPGNQSGGNSGYSGGGGEPDWAKTNYRIDVPQQPAARPPDDFGKTAINIKPIDVNRQDFGKTMYPGAGGGQAASADWGATQANVNVNPADFGSAQADWGGSGPDKTTPYFQLPESERAKYQQLPPTPTEQAAQAAEEQRSKGGIPGWVWVVAGLMTMFFFAVAVLGIVYFFILRDSSYNATIKGAPAGSDIMIDDEPWGVSSENGDSVIPNLAPGKKRIITIRHPSFTCDPMTVEGEAGKDPPPVIARCKASQNVQPTGDCTNFEPGEDDRAETCYNAALAALPDTYTAEQLVRALNILIINFETNRFDVPPRRYAALQKAATYIKKLPADVTLEIGGHTDSDGSAATNQKLSENRANSVKNFLVQNGVNGSILQTRGYGADKPKKDNTTPAGKYANRRIEYMIVSKPK